MPKPIDLCLIYGSARAGRFCDTVADWVRAERHKRSEFRLGVVDPLDGHDRLVWWSQALSQARARHPYRAAA